MPMDRRTLVVALAVALPLAACSKTETAKTYEVEEVTLAQISADLAAGKTTSAAVTQAYIDRIKKYDPQLHAVISIAPDALTQAKAADDRRKAGKAIGPLDGIPVLLKDNIDAVGIPTTAGSYALVENFPTKDAEVTRRLRAAGAVILGKANLSQWAGLRTTDAFNGSTFGGSPKNPYDLKRTPAGSSSGSGVAAAASFAAATVGTDTTGSIIGPSNNNGVVGIRPTIALLSRHGVVPVSSTQDTTGPMGRSVKDVAMMLTVMAGSDPADPDSADADANKTDYTKGLTTDALKGKRIGVIRGFGGYSEATKPAFDQMLEVVKAQGAELVDIPLDIFEDLAPEQRLIMYWDIKDDMAAYLANAPAAVKVRTLADIIEYNKTEEHEKQHGQQHFEAAQALDGKNSADYQKVHDYARKRAGEDGYGRALKEYNVSALVMLTRGPAGEIPPDGTERSGPALDRPKGEQVPSGSGQAALAGYPDLSVPGGMVDGMPVGLSFIGSKWSEATLLSYAYAFEQAAHARVPPKAYKDAVVATKN